MDAPQVEIKCSILYAKHLMENDRGPTPKKKVPFKNKDNLNAFRP